MLKAPDFILAAILAWLATVIDLPGQQDGADQLVAALGDARSPEEFPIARLGAVAAGLGLRHAA